MKNRNKEQSSKVQKQAAMLKDLPQQHLLLHESFQQLKTILFHLNIKCHIPILASRKFSKLFIAEMTTGISWSVSKFTAVTEVSESENKCNDHSK